MDLRTEDTIGRRARGQHVIVVLAVGRRAPPFSPVLPVARQQVLGRSTGEARRFEEVTQQIAAGPRGGADQVGRSRRLAQLRIHPGP